MFDALIDRKDRKVARPGEPAVSEQGLQATERTHVAVRPDPKPVDRIGRGRMDQAFADLPADMIEVERGLASQNFLDFRIHSQIRFREVGTDPAFSSIVAFPEDESLRSLLFSLTGDGLHHLPDLFRIAEEIVTHEVQPAIELENVGSVSYTHLSGVRIPVLPQRNGL